MDRQQYCRILLFSCFLCGTVTCTRLVEKPLTLLNTTDLSSTNYTPRHIAGYFKVVNFPTCNLVNCFIREILTTLCDLPKLSKKRPVTNMILMHLQLDRTYDASMWASLLIPGIHHLAETEKGLHICLHCMPRMLYITLTHCCLMGGKPKPQASWCRFYFFFEQREKPQKDSPLILWMTGQLLILKKKLYPMTMGVTLYKLCPLITACLALCHEIKLKLRRLFPCLSW